jgi:hypothetical protein
MDVLNFVRHDPLTEEGESDKTKTTAALQPFNCSYKRGMEARAHHQPAYFMNWRHETAEMGVQPGNRRVLDPRRT